jgi:hypothetical protein
MKPLAVEAESISALASNPLYRRSLEVHLSAEIAAAQRCLFYALSLPEYLEARLDIPDTTNLRAAVSNLPDELRIDRYCSLQHVGSILIRFHAVSWDSIRLNWHNCTDVNTPST